MEITTRVLVHLLCEKERSSRRAERGETFPARGRARAAVRARPGSSRERLAETKQRAKCDVDAGKIRRVGVQERFVEYASLEFVIRDDVRAP